MSNFDKPTEDVLRQVEKLLRLAEKNDNVHQATAAAAKAQELMLKYNVSESALNKEQSISTVAEGQLKSRGGDRYTWQEDLLRGICKTNFSAVYRYNDSGATHGTEAVIIGQPQDVEVVRYLFAYLFGQIQSLGLKAFHEAQRDGRTQFKWSAPYMRDWAPGAVEGVLEVLTAQRRQDEQEAPVGSMALIVARDTLVEDYIYTKRYGMTRAEKAAFDKACTEAHADGELTAKLTEGEYELSDAALRALKHLYPEPAYLKQFEYGWDHVMWYRKYERQQAEQEVRIASGEIKRPRERGGQRRTYYRSEGPGRKQHQTDYDARDDGYRTGKRIAIRPAIEKEGTHRDDSPRRLGQ